MWRLYWQFKGEKAEIRLITIHASAAEVKMHQHRDVATKTHSIQYNSGNKRFYIGRKLQLKAIYNLQYT